MTIYNIKGTNGSGKSYAVMAIMGAYGVVESVEVTRPDRKAPTVIGYSCKDGDLQNLFVLGQYKTTCGGCDGFSWRGSYLWIFERIREYNRIYGNVIYEGMTLSGDRNWISGLSYEGLGVEAIYLETTLEDCHIAVNLRRAEKGKEPLEDFSRVDCKYKTVERGKPILTEREVPWVLKTRDTIVPYILEKLSE